MKAIIFISLISILTVFHNNIYCESKVQASFQYGLFYSSDNGPFIETYLTVLGNTSTFVLNKNNNFQSSIEITIIFKQEGNIVNFSKNILLSPEIKDSLAIKPNFIDQQRFSLPNGIYNMELIIKDMGAGSQDFSFNDIIKVNFEKDKISFSGVQFIESYSETKTENILSKNGYDLIPYVANYFPSNMSKIIFYTEVYNIKTVINPDEEFLLRYFIQNAGNNRTIEEYSRIKKQKADDVNIIFSNLDITELKSGNYNLIIEVKDKNNETLKEQKVFFQRSNPEKDIDLEDIESINISEIFTNKYQNIDTLKDYFKCIRPITDDVEKRFLDNQVNSTSLEYLQQYFYSFWAKRNKVNPEEEWEYYKKQVNLVDKLYSTSITKGYESDRGRIYLKYGSPNKISESKHEPSAYPFEIWHYYNLGENETKQVNVKFVFYNPDIVGNDYDLLHSNARGEIYDKNWERRLSKRNNSMYNHDATNSQEQFGSKALELWNE